jgi:hypothetical protein
MAELTVVYEAVCEKCGVFLDATTRDGKYGPEVVVAPCETCLANAKEGGRSGAYDEGYKQAEEDAAIAEHAADRGL